MLSHVVCLVCLACFLPTPKRNTLQSYKIKKIETETKKMWGLDNKNALIKFFFTIPPMTNLQDFELYPFFDETD